MTSKPKIGVIGDWISGHTGFGLVNHGIFSNLLDKYDVAQLAINYDGSYHPDQSKYRYYVASDFQRQDLHGISKVKQFIERENPDILFVLQDPYIADKYITRVREVRPELPAVLYTPVDCLGLDRLYVNVLNLYNRVVAYTDFGRNELRKSGLTVQCDVIPHGLDTENIHPIEQKEARSILELDDKDRFIVLYVAQNQPRKRVDLFIYAFSEWLKRYPNDDAYLYYHGPIFRHGGIDVRKVMAYYAKQHKDIDFKNRFIATDDNPNTVVRRDSMKYIYGAADLYFQAASNEGWAMGLHEAMGAKRACIVPDHSAMSEWTIGSDGPGCFFIPVDDKPNWYTSNITTMHQDFNTYWAVEALETLYRSEHARSEVARRGYQVATQDKFHWKNVAQRFDAIFAELLAARTETNTELQSEEN